MAKGCCSGDTCSCLITAGAGVTVTGSGSTGNPYVVEAILPDFSDSLTVRDTPTVNLSLQGSGTPANPFILQGTATVALTDLIDVDDPEGGPVVGDVPVWVGIGVDGHWEFKAPPVAPAGSVNVTGGLEGAGTVPSPIKVSTSGTWGVGDLAGLGADTTIGLEIYVDANGDLRAQPVSGGTVSWASITGKPATFQPSAHTHTAAAITDQQNLDAGKVGGHRVFSQLTPPVGATQGDLWFRWA